MTRIPTESWSIAPVEGDMFPRYKVASMCAVPSCTKFTDHAHHIVRRSFLAGDYAWVRYYNGDIAGNLAGLCYKHHEEVTLGTHKIIYEERFHKYAWCEMRNCEWNTIAPLYPHPPVHDRHVHEEETGVPELVGPGSTNMCPGCGRPVKQKKEGQKEQAKRRKTWTVTVPATVEEDGALVLSTLLEECAVLFGRDMESANIRYFVLAQALALVVQNGHLLS